jgi:methyltransferase
VTTVAVIVGIILGLMVAETRVSIRHARALVAQGAVAPPGDVYGLMAVVYPGAFLAMFAEAAWTGPPDSDGPSWFAAGAVMFVASKALKYWAIRSLGPRWSFRVLVLPGVPLVTTGPYRYVAHPNYIAVMGELVGAAMMCGAVISGTVAVVAFGAVLAVRIRVEGRALRA